MCWQKYFRILLMIHVETYNSALLLVFSMLCSGRSSKLGGCFRWFTLGWWWISSDSFRCRWSVCSFQHGRGKGDFLFSSSVNCASLLKYCLSLIVWLITGETWRSKRQSEKRYWSHRSWMHKHQDFDERSEDAIVRQIR